MDRIQQVTYEKDFQIEFSKSKGDGFQRIFETLMSKVHPNDFIPCRPSGRDGDWKNDGYLRSAHILFQCYAPNELKTALTIKKIKEDFEGAKVHWKEHIAEWVFVHNAQDGRLPPAVVKALLTLASQNPKIKISHWGYEELLAKFRLLSLEDCESWFGLSPTVEANLHLGYSDLEAVLEHIRVAPIPEPSEVKDVSRGKLEANLLSQSVADFLKIGMQKSLLVAKFFDNFYDPIYGEQIASAFKKKYQALRDTTPRLHPDLIFGHLEEWALGTENMSPSYRTAVLAVLAYLFDKCEIFEDAQAARPA